jgi:hypothetical protein
VDSAGSNIDRSFSQITIMAGAEWFTHIRRKRIVLPNVESAFA